jgi:hypothetical protein
MSRASGLIESVNASESAAVRAIKLSLPGIPAEIGLEPV